jgi:phosphatidylglycerol:prolipoprotein diacylglycerol transferase
MTIYPFTLHLGPLAITGYGLMMMIAFLMAGWVIQVDLRRRGRNEDYAADIVFAAVIGGIIGAKLWYVLLSGEWNSLFSRGGFVWYGGFLGGLVTVILNGWRKGVAPRWTLELTAAALPLGHALGRVGCFLVNDDYGIPSTLPWAMKFPDGLPPTTVANLEQMHVTFPPNTDPTRCIPPRFTRRRHCCSCSGGCGGCAITATARGGCSASTWCWAERNGSWSSSCGRKTTACSVRSRSRRQRARSS